MRGTLWASQSDGFKINFTKPEKLFFLLSKEAGLNQDYRTESVCDCKVVGTSLFVTSQSQSCVPEATLPEKDTVLSATSHVLLDSE